MPVPRDSDPDGSHRAPAAHKLSAKTRNYRFRYIGQRFRFLDPASARECLSDADRGITLETKAYLKSFPPPSESIQKEVRLVDECSVEQRLLRRHQDTVEGLLRQLTIEENALYNRNLHTDDLRIHMEANSETCREDPTTQSTSESSEDLGYQNHVHPQRPVQSPSRRTGSAGVTFDDCNDESLPVKMAVTTKNDARVVANIRKESEIDFFDSGYKPYPGEEVDKLLVEAEMARLPSALGGVRATVTAGSSRGASRGMSRGGSRNGGVSRASSRSRSREKERSQPFVRGDPPLPVPPLWTQESDSSRTIQQVRGVQEKTKIPLSSILQQIDAVDDILNSMSVIEEGTSVLEGSVMMEGNAGQVRDGGRRHQFSAFPESESSSESLYHRNLEDAVLDSDHALVGEYSGLEADTLDFDGDWGHTASGYSKPDSATYEEALHLELLSAQYDHLGNGAEVIGIPSIDPSATTQQHLGHAIIKELSEDLNEELMHHPRHPIKHEKNQGTDEQVDMHGFPFFVPGSAQSQAKPEGDVFTEDQKEFKYRKPRQHQDHPAETEPDIAPMPYAVERHGGELHDLHEPGLVHTYARHSMSHNVYKDGFRFDLARAHARYRTQQKEALERAIREAEKEAARAAEHAAATKAYRDAKHSRRNATLLGEQQESSSDEDNESDANNEHDRNSATAAVLSGEDTDCSESLICPLQSNIPDAGNMMTALRPSNAPLGKEELRDLAIAIRNIHVFYRNYGRDISAAETVTGIQEHRGTTPREVLVTPDTPYGISMLPMPAESDLMQYCRQHDGNVSPNRKRRSTIERPVNVPVVVHLGSPEPRKESFLRDALALDLSAVGVHSRSEPNQTDTKANVTISAREYERTEQEKIQIPAHRVTAGKTVGAGSAAGRTMVPVTARTDQELGVGSWRVMMPALPSQRSSAKAASKVTSDLTSKSALKQTANGRVLQSSKKQVDQLRIRAQSPIQNSPVLPRDRYGNTYQQHDIKTSSPISHTPQAPSDEVNKTRLKFQPSYSATNRRVLRKLATVEQEERDAVARAAESQKRQGARFQHHFLDLKAQREAHVVTAQETTAKLLELPIAEAFATYTMEELKRNPGFYPKKLS